MSSLGAEADVLTVMPRETAPVPQAPPPRRYKVLLADDHPLVREGIRASLETVEELEVVGQAADGTGAVDLARSVRPDVVLMDISMPGMTGLEATRVLRKELPATKVLILTVHEKKEYVMEVVRSGASGYVLKDSAPEELIRAIRSVLQEGQFFSPKVARWASAKYLKPAGRRLRRQGWNELSPQEKEVLTMIAQGFLNKEIARRMGLKFFTVLTYRRRIMRKLSIHNIAGLTNYAIRNGYLSVKKDTSPGSSSCA